MANDSAEEQLKRVRGALGEGKESFKTVDDALLKLGGTSRKSVATLRSQIKAMEQWNKAGKGGPALLKATAKSQKEYAQALLKSAAGGAVLGKNMFAMRQYQDANGKFTQSMRPITALISQATVGGKELAQYGNKFMGALEFLNPTWAKAVGQSKNFSDVMAGLGVAGLIASVAVKIFLNSFKATFDSFKSLNRSVGTFSVSLNDALHFASSATMAQVKYNASQEDFSAVMNSLSSSYGINTMKMKSLGENWSAQLGDSIGQFLGMSKVMGMTSSEAGGLASSLVMLGYKVNQLPEAFVEFRQMLDKTEMAPMALTEALATIAPVSLTSATAAKYMVGALTQFKVAFQKSTDPIIEFARSGGGAKAVQDAMMSFSKAAAGLSLPEIMAFGGAQEPGVDPMAAITKALDQRMSRPEMLVNYFRKVAESAAAGQEKFAIFAAASQKGFSPEAAYTAIDAIQTLIREGAKGTADDKTRQAAMAKAIDQMAIASAATEDPMQKLVSLATSMLTAILGMMNIFRPGAGSALNSNLSMANQTVQLPTRAPAPTF